MKHKFTSLTITIMTVLVFIGCGPLHSNVRNINGTDLDKSQLLTKESSIYLVNGGDGMKKTLFSSVYGEEVSIGSGLSAINIAFDQLKWGNPHVILENKVLSEKEALENATLNNSDYVIYSRVETWTDPLGISCSKHYMDEASVVISLYSTKEQKLLKTTRLSAKDCPSTLNGMPLSPGSPERLYEKLFSQWTRNIFVSNN
ncbi:DUF4823 domain-containing protein [Sulfurospirillum arsenophilum]|uniref:DUF4823 domain-containing protein n=1 Tax=Sulfurospirillum arsenophilum TaxID=56698 RepID=UPI0005AACDF5|nr:DUF4823 domain-containing protein [Sulfurospirillum arsenophilum]